MILYWVDFYNKNCLFKLILSHVVSPFLLIQLDSKKHNELSYKLFLRYFYCYRLAVVVIVLSLCLIVNINTKYLWYNATL